MNAKEQQRLMVLNQVISEEVTGQRAATLMEVSLRQMRRLLAAYRKEGAAALAHGNRGRVPIHALSAALKERLVVAAQTTYAPCNFAHLRDLLEEREGLKVSHSSVWRVLRAAGITSAHRRRRPRHRSRRQRMPQEGVLLQIDGSHHPWLGERGPVLTLLLAIDDATGTPPYGLFREREDTGGYFLLLKGIIERRGIPLGIYTDRHAVFQTRGASASAAADQEPEPTQFGRALKELGITAVFAQSPEAKGRIERANGTFQDRLGAELSLAGASTAEEANRVLWDFLPRFSARFGVPAAQPGSAYRAVEEGFDVDSVLCFKEWRRVARDNTVQYRGKSLQLFPGLDRPSYARARVEVQERLDGRILVSYRGKILTPQNAPPLAAELRIRAEARPADGWPSPDDFLPAELLEHHTADALPRSPLSGDPVWYLDVVKKNLHRDLVRVGMERARQLGKHVGRPPVTERQGFAERFAAVMERLREGELSRRQAAKELEIGYATLKRLLEAQTQPSQKQGTPALTVPHLHPEINAIIEHLPDPVLAASRGDTITETLG